MRQKQPAYHFQNRSLKNLPGEKWRDLPGFDGEYEISSLGRIKSLRRWRANGSGGGYYTEDMIRKLPVRVSKNRLLSKDTYTVTCTIRKDGKQIGRSVSRYVYYAFVAPFDLDDSDLLISYKDFEGRNLDYKNLFLTNRSAISARSFQFNRAQSPFLPRRIPVRQLTIDGKTVATYSSISEAEKKTGIQLSGIFACVTGRIYQYHGFRWKATSKKFPLPSIKEDSKQFFNEYLWKRIGKPRTSKKDPIAVLNLSAENMKGERWKLIEGLEKAYLISNFGRVKGLARFKNGRLQVWTKERVKRLIPDGKRPNETTCLLAHFSNNGEEFQQSMTRLVYHHFVKKIDLQDRGIRIGYKNGKFYDLSSKNLFIQRRARKIG